MERNKRQIQIESVIGSLKTEIDKGEVFTFEDVVMSTMANLFVSRRTAIELCSVAFFKLKLSKK